MTPIDGTSRDWRRAPLTEVCHRVASAVLHNSASLSSAHAADEAPSDPATALPDGAAVDAFKLGCIALRAHQVDAVVRLRSAIAEHGGALLADTVGLGKTYVGLALAREYSDVQVLAPAALLPMWRAAVAATKAPATTIRSLHAFSRRNFEAIHRAAASDRRSLVIVDEAHYLRTRSTARYRNVARFCTNRDVLLISATPLHNRPRELGNLLALFLGERADAMDEAVLAHCVVRRSSAHGALPIPAVKEHRALVLSDNPAVLECILTVASPLPTQDGGAAGALIRLGLLRAWCSSDAALTDTIRRRQLRAEAMLHSLSEGRYPTQRELQSWIVGTDSVQLGFSELLVQTATTDCAELIKTVVAHLDCLQALLQLHTRTSHTDPMRAAYLRQLLHEPLDVSSLPRATDVHSPEPGTRPPVIAFSQFASTVRALHRALGDIAGIASLTSAGGRIASGNIPREQLVEQFAPRANGRPPPHARERINLLLTTDLLAEGVNLQDADTVVHLDLPWTDALRKQRVGRLVRMGSEHAVVHVHTFAPPMGTERALRIVAVLRYKAGLHAEWIGDETNIAAGAATTATSAADQATQLRERLQMWVNASPHGDSAQPDSSNVFPVAILRGTKPGFLAAVAVKGQIRLLVDIPGGVSSQIHVVLKGVLAIDPQRPIEPSPSCELDPLCVAEPVAQIERWVAERSVQEIAGESSRQLAPLQQRALRLLSARISSLPATGRSTMRRVLANAEHQILTARGAGAEMALNDWIESGATQPFSQWLTNVPVFRPSGRALESHLQHTSGNPSQSDWCVVAMVLFRAESDAGCVARC